MKISEETINFLARHGKKMNDPVLLIYYSKAKGWWGIERKVQLKHTENPFESNQALHYVTVDYMHYPIENCPCSVFLDKEMQLLVENATIDLEKRGMYRFLALTY